MGYVFVVSLDEDDAREALSVVREVNDLPGVEAVLLCTDNQARAVRHAVDW